MENMVGMHPAAPASEVTIDTASRRQRKAKAAPEPTPQFGALPWRTVEGGRIEVLLISSRDTGRWIIPKGWPIAGRTGAETAAIEAFEEAGLKGEPGAAAIGSFDYRKCDKRRPDRLCRVTVYPFRVEEELPDWPEKAERTLCWLAPLQAADRVDDAGLATLIRHFAGVDPLAGARPD